MQPYIPLTLESGDPISVWTDRIIRTSNQGTLVEAVNEATHQELVAKLSHVFPEESTEADIAKEKMNMLRELHILPRLRGIYGVPQFIHSERVVAGSSQEQFVLLMSKMNGIDLEQRRKQDPKHRLTTEEAIAMLKQVASILYDAHERNVIHRDLKLSNFMVDDKGYYSIVDWGTAKDLKHLEQDRSWSTPEHTVIGTVQFMSYEHITGQELDIRTDIYSLGAVVALLRYGPEITQRYIVDENGKIIARHKDRIAKAVAKKESLKYHLMPEADTNAELMLQTVLRKMTQPDKESRFASMQEVLDTL